MELEGVNRAGRKGRLMLMFAHELHVTWPGNYCPPGVHKGQWNGLSGLVVFEEHDIEKGASYNQRAQLTKVEATRCLSITSREHDHSPRRPTPSHWLGTYTSEIPGQVTLTFIKRAHQCRESAAWSLTQVYTSPSVDCSRSSVSVSADNRVYVCRWSITYRRLDFVVFCTRHYWFAVTLSSRGQSGLDAKILASASASKLCLGLGLKHLASAWPLSRCLIM